MKIELESFNVSIVEDGEDFIARIRFNRADDRLIVGDSGTGLMDEVIEVVQAHMFASYTKGTCDWKESLIERPKN